MKRMARTDWTITVEQKEWLIEEAKRRGLTVSKLLRKIINQLQKKQAAKTTPK